MAKPTSDNSFHYDKFVRNLIIAPNFVYNDLPQTFYRRAISETANSDRLALKIGTCIEPTEIVDRGVYTIFKYTITNKTVNIIKNISCPFTPSEIISVKVRMPGNYLVTPTDDNRFIMNVHVLPDFCNFPVCCTSKIEIDVKVYVSRLYATKDNMKFFPIRIEGLSLSAKAIEMLKSQQKLIFQKNIALMSDPDNLSQSSSGITITYRVNKL
jgi:hypothetical protein